MPFYFSKDLDNHEDIVEVKATSCWIRKLSLRVARMKKPAFVMLKHLDADVAQLHTLEGVLFALGYSDCANELKLVNTMRMKYKSFSFSLIANIIQTEIEEIVSNFSNLSHVTVICDNKPDKSLFSLLLQVLVNLRTIGLRDSGISLGQYFKHCVNNVYENESSADRKRAYSTMAIDIMDLLDAYESGLELTNFSDYQFNEERYPAIKDYIKFMPSRHIRKCLRLLAIPIEKNADMYIPLIRAEEGQTLGSSHYKHLTDCIEDMLSNFESKPVIQALFEEPISHGISTECTWGTGFPLSLLEYLFSFQCWNINEINDTYFLLKKLKEEGAPEDVIFLCEACFCLSLQCTSKAPLLAIEGENERASIGIHLNNLTESSRLRLWAIFASNMHLNCTGINNAYLNNYQKYLTDAFEVIFKDVDKIPFDALLLNSLTRRVSPPLLGALLSEYSFSPPANTDIIDATDNYSFDYDNEKLMLLYPYCKDVLRSVSVEHRFNSYQKWKSRLREMSIILHKQEGYFEFYTDIKQATCRTDILLIMKVIHGDRYPLEAIPHLSRPELKALCLELLSNS